MSSQGPKRQGAQKSLSKQKGPFWIITRSVFSKKGPFGPRNDLHPAKQDLFSALMNLFREERAYLQPKGTFQAENGPFGDEKEHFRTKKKSFGVERALWDPAMSHFNQTNSLWDPKRVHFRLKMVLWKRKRTFQSKKDPFWSRKRSFCCRKFPSRPKRARRA